MPEFLTTERLILRDLAETDLDDLVELDNDPEVMRYLNGGKPVPREELRDTILPKLMRGYHRYGGRPGYWVAESRTDRQFLGWFALTPTATGLGRCAATDAPSQTGRNRPDEAELGYRLRRSAWGAGYGTEGSTALIRKGFTELGLTRVIAQTMAVNAPSRRVMEKSGLIYVRTFHETWDDPLPGTELGEVEYALDVQEWRRQRKA